MFIVKSIIVVRKTIWMINLKQNYTIVDLWKKKLCYIFLYPKKPFM